MQIFGQKLATDLNPYQGPYPTPERGPSSASSRVQGGGPASAAPRSAGDDISSISFDQGGDNKWMHAMGGCYVPQGDGHGKYTPCPRTKVPRTDHGMPGDNKKHKRADHR